MNNNTDDQKTVMTEDEIIEYTRSKRIQLANSLTKSGAPTDKDNQHVLLATLDGLDRSALGRLKIKADEKVGANSANAASLIAEVLNKIGSNKIYQVENPVRREIPILSSDIPEPIVVEGELDINPPMMDFDSFTKQFEDQDSV